MSPVFATWLENRQYRTVKKGLPHVRAAAEFNARAPPLRVINVLCYLVDIPAQHDNANRVRVRLAEDRTQARDTLRSGEVELLAEYAHVLRDPALADRLDVL
jgi:hypothetical protein